MKNFVVTDFADDSVSVRVLTHEEIGDVQDNFPEADDIFESVVAINDVYLTREEALRLAEYLTKAVRKSIA